VIRDRLAATALGGGEARKIGAVSDRDPLSLEGWDHVELWVGNAKQAAYYYEHALGFRRHAYCGPETGVRDRASYVLRQGEVTLVVTNGLSADHEVSRFASNHGDGVRDIALRVRDAADIYEVAVEHGARGVREPEWLEDDQGRVQVSSIATYGDVVHSFVARDDYAGTFLPGYAAAEENGRDGGVGLTLLDHCVGNVELGKMDEWVGFYQRVLGFENIIHYDDEQIHTEYSALMSKVMADGEGKIKFPINEPAEGRRKSQIAEYLEYNAGPGVQHVAIQSDDIVRTVEALQERGISFLRTPDAYYEDAFDRVGEIEESWGDLRRLGILVDRDEDGYLLQIFTKPAQDRPTLFFEVIQRHGARTFGEGNFKALFEAIEREQALRGNL
jgi:4-hydroxyphenylpyruvate dioxygenase